MQEGAGAQSRSSQTVRTVPKRLCSYELTGSVDFSQDKVTTLLSELRASGFEPYSTAVGGSGLGVFHPHGDAVEQTSKLGKAFTGVEAPGLGAWAEGGGRWLYV